MKCEVNFIGAKPVYPGRSLFHRGFAEIERSVFNRGGDKGFLVYYLIA